MRKVKKREVETRICVDTTTLAGMLGCGILTANRIGREAGARVQVGRRVLYRVAAVEEYLEKKSREGD